MGMQERYCIRFNMYKISLFLNLFFNLLYLGMLHETKEYNRINNVPLTQVIPSETLENIFKYNERSTTVKSKLCDKNKNTQFRLSDEEERKWMPLLNLKIRKPLESPNNKADTIKLDYSQLQKLTFVNNSDNKNLDQYRELREFQRLSNILLHELSNNESNEQEDENLKFVTAKENRSSFSDTKKEKVGNKNDLNLLPIVMRKGPYKQTHLYNNKSDSVSVQWIATQTPENILNLTTGNSATEETTKGNIRKSIRNDYDVDSEDNLQEDTSFGSESIEFNNDSDKKAESEKSKEVIDINNNNDVNESDSIEYVDKSKLDFTNIKEQLESKHGIKINEISNSRVLLMESHRICYACASSNDPSCLTPDRQTTVKYCHKDNMACVAKSYTIGRSNYIIRDCGSSCLSSDINGLSIKYDTCSICHSDLCNSAYSIKIFTAPSILLAFIINRIIY